MATYDGPMESALVVLRDKPGKSDECLAALAALVDNVKTGLYSGEEVAAGLLAIIRSPGSSTNAKENALIALSATAKHSSECKDALATAESITTMQPCRAASMQGIAIGLFEALRVRMLMRKLCRWVDNGIDKNRDIKQSLIRLSSVKAIVPLVRMMANADGHGGESLAGDVLEGLFRSNRPVVELGLTSMGSTAFDLLAKATEYKHTKMIAFILLGMGRDPRLLDLCARALEDKAADSTSKWGVIVALGNLKDRRATDMLRGLSQDADPRTRELALKALKEHGETRI